MLRLGIIGTGRIAERFMTDAWQMQGFVISAVYNPRIESAKRFVQAKAGALAKRDLSVQDVVCTDELEIFMNEVDAVYVASPHDTHFSYAKKLLENGKHVLCEKPMCFSEAQVTELFAIAKKNNVVLMEALKTAYCPGFLGLLEVLESGKIGDLVGIETCFTRLTATNTREWTDTLYGGSFTELGSYVLFPVMKLLGADYKDVHFHSRYVGEGPDAFTKVDFDYGDRFASCKTGIGVKSEGQMILTGTKGYIVVKAPWWLTKSFEIRYENPNQVDLFEYPYEGSGLCYECEAFYDLIEEFSRCKEEEEKELFWNYAFHMGEAESKAMAAVFEAFLKQEGRMEKQYSMQKIWGHRGCSMEYPENTLEAFLAAANTPGVAGIELDVQLTKDGEVVVFHDENVKRVTNGDRDVREYTLAELKALKVAPGSEKETTIPTLEEVLQAMEPYCKENGFMINIELKTSRIRYEGIEEKTYELVKSYGLEKYIVYSSFLADSVKRMKEIDPDCKTGMLASSLTECIRLGQWAGVDALHPWIGGLDCEIPEEMKGYPVRAWNGEEPSYEDGRILKEHHLEKYGMFGVTEIITNVPENY